MERQGIDRPEAKGRREEGGGRREEGRREERMVSTKCVER